MTPERQDAVESSFVKREFVARLVHRLLDSALLDDLNRTS
jgi:hypothetical protein